MRPRVGFRPTRPGARRRDADRAAAVAAVREREPCHSATAAAAPPLEPPGVRGSVSHGLRVGPNLRGSDTGRIPNSGMFVLPTMTKPASRTRRVTWESCPGTKSPNRSDPIRVRHPRNRGGVLHRDRHARERPRIVPVYLGRCLQRALSVDVNERVDGGLELLDAFERGGHKLGRADLSGMNQRRQLTGRPE